jgi:hypothetical protein
LRSRLYGQERVMPITEFLDGFTFEPETKRVMGLAFEMARAALRLSDRRDFIIEILAKKIIAHAKDGLHDPNLLCEWALDDLRILGQYQ